MPTPILEISDVTLCYNAVEHCRDINASVREGSFVLFLGANGKGKSTLLITIAGLQPAMKGEISVDNKNIIDYPIKDLAKKIAFLPSSHEMVDGLLVIELLSFSRIPFKTWFQNTNVKDMNIITKVAQQTGILELLDQTYNTLSDGQKQKVNIARCLVQETRIILLDEPTAHLDIVNKIQIFELIRSLTKDGKTIICTTHDVRDASAYATHFWMIDNNGKFKTSEFDSTVTPDDLIAKLF